MYTGILVKLVQNIKIQPKSLHNNFMIKVRKVYFFFSNIDTDILLLCATVVNNFS